MAISEGFLTGKRDKVRSGYLSNVQESAQRSTQWWRLMPAASHGQDSPNIFAKLTAAPPVSTPDGWSALPRR